MKLSIIIPCYNCVGTLGEAVKSCFAQGVENFEIVMVDDGSTDDTRTVMRKLADKHPEIKLFYHDKNRGGGATRNTAVMNSRAEVIFCLDSDDILPENTLSSMLSFMNEKQCDGVTIDRSIKFSGADIRDVHHIDKSPYSDERIELASLFFKNCEFSPLYVNFLYTKNAFNKIGGYPTTHGYDTQGFAWRFLCAGLIVYVCPDTEYFHRVNYKESYFLREYNSGKMNYNWRDILLEHYYVFSEDTLNFICNFDCSDFTKNLMAELVKRDNILIVDYDDTFSRKYPPLQKKLQNVVYIKRKSIKGFYLRIKYKIRKMLCKN